MVIKWFHSPPPPTLSVGFHIYMYVCIKGLSLFIIDTLVLLMLNSWSGCIFISIFTFSQQLLFNTWVKLDSIILGPGYRWTVHHWSRRLVHHWGRRICLGVSGGARFQLSTAAKFPSGAGVQISSTRWPTNSALVDDHETQCSETYSGKWKRLFPYHYQCRMNRNFWNNVQWTTFRVM